MGWRGWKARRERRDADALRKGEIIRQLHWQCWREDAPSLETPLAGLVDVLPVLIESGSVGLVWPRLWHRAEELGAVGAALAAAYEAQVAHNARVERDIARVVTRLREHDVEPVLIKGLAVARLYPPPLVRPAGDIDLVVHDADYAGAKATLADLRISFHRDDNSARQQREQGSANVALEIDLHNYLNWKEAPGPDFFEFTDRASFADVPVSVPNLIGHIGALSLHFLSHSGVRPVRLCDIALLLELDDGEAATAHSQDNYPRTDEHIAVCADLAKHLLDASARNSIGFVTNGQVPHWVIETVLQNWGNNPVMPGPVVQEVRDSPFGLFRTFSKRWPDPIRATVHTGARFDGRSRFPVQLASYANQIAEFARERLLRQIRDAWSDKPA